MEDARAPPRAQIYVGHALLSRDRAVSRGRHDRRGVRGAHLFGGTPSFQAVSSLFGGPKPLRRLSVSEQFNLDSRRRLILVRRDDVEHLIMTGGPVDVVIETGIGAPAHPTHDAEAEHRTPASQRVDPTLA